MTSDPSTAAGNSEDEGNIGRRTRKDTSGLNESHAPGDSDGTPTVPEEPQRGPENYPQGTRYGRDETARNPNLGPEPASTPGLENGGGVNPGETPPESNSATASPPHEGAKRPPMNKVIVGAVAAIALIVALFFIAYAAGLIA